MTASTAPARRLAVVLTMAGMAAFGSIAVAPSASAAAPDWAYTEHGQKVKAPHYCDPEKPNRQHNNCIELDGPRF